MENVKKKTKKGKIIWTVVGAVLGALTVFLLIWYLGASYPDYDAVKKEEFSIPGLNKISPQGLCVLPENEQGYDFAMSGYMTDKTPSKIYLIDADTNTSKYVTVKNGDKLSAAHFGGVTCTPNYLCVTSGKSILRIPLQAALAAENGATVTVFDSFKTDVNNAYCCYSEGTMYVGEFYRPGNYETAETHHIAVTGGTNYAYVYAFRVDEGMTGGIASSTPEYAISVREQVQGFVVHGEGITLSCSYGLADSRLFTYANNLGATTDKTATVGGVQIPLYILDDDNLKSEIIAPCMSEEICVKEGRLYVLYESLCDKYMLFTRTRIDRVHSLPVNALKGEAE